MQEGAGDDRRRHEKAVVHLRKQGTKIKETRLGRETAAGRIAVYSDFAGKVGAMIEIQCESAPVAGSPEFREYAAALAKQLATGPGAKTPEELLKQPSPIQAGQTLGEQKDDMFNRIREVFNLARILRYDGPCGAYAHHDGSIGALVEVRGGNADAAKDVAMHIRRRSRRWSRRRISIRPRSPRSGKFSPKPPARKASPRTSFPR